MHIKKRFEFDFFKRGTTLHLLICVRSNEYPRHLNCHGLEFYETLSEECLPIRVIRAMQMKAFIRVPHNA